MPEGPELHLASLFVNRMCEGVVFTGPVEKSEVSKSPEVPFTCDAYRVTATSRGKEVRLTLTPIKSDDAQGRVTGRQNQQPMDVVFRFGMSGYFCFTAEEELPKHSHLRCYTNENPCRALSFVDARRFGSWQPNGSWQRDRGPCVMFEYESFRENVLCHLSDKAFDRPICETLLNQKYFSGIGNYLRAEILFRLNIPPFAKARTVLEGLQSIDADKKLVKEEITPTEISDSREEMMKTDKRADLLSLCHTVPLEVVKLGGKGYDLDPAKADHSNFEAWLQCYYVDGMTSLRDHNGRTIWFKGDPGPMAPTDLKSPKAKKRVKKEGHDHTDRKKQGAKTKRMERATKGKVARPKRGAKTVKGEEEEEEEEEESQKRSKRVEQQVDPSEQNNRPRARRKSSTAVSQRQSGPKRARGVLNGQEVTTPKESKRPKAGRKSSTAGSAGNDSCLPPRATVSLINVELLYAGGKLILRI